MDSETKDILLAKQIGDTLYKHYPGYLWAIEIKSGVVDIKNLNISGKYGYRLHLTTVQADPNLKCVMRAAGEILERAHLDRGKNKGEECTHLDGARFQDNFLRQFGIKV